MSRRFWLVVALLGMVLGQGAVTAQEHPAVIEAIALETLVHPEPVAGAAGNANQLLTWAHDGELRLWEWPDLSATVQTFSLDGWVEGVRWKADNTGFLAWNNAPYTCLDPCEFAVNVWQNLAAQPLMLPHPTRIYAAEWSGDEQRIVSAAEDALRVWDVDTRSIVASMAHDGAVLGAQWSHDNRTILAWSADGSIRVWDAENGTEISRLLHGAWVDGAQWLADERQILSWGRDGVMRLWDAQTGDVLRIFEDGAWINAVEVSTDGQRLLTAGASGWVRLWSLENGEVLQAFSVAGSILDAQWNHDESQILLHALARESLISVWDAHEGYLLSVLPHRSVVRGVGWNEDESRILTWDNEGLVRVWIVPQADDCFVRTPHDSVNRRSLPNVNASLMGRLVRGEVWLALGQSAVNADGLRWWQLSDGAWVREDVVEIQGRCENLPIVEPFS